MKALSIKSVVSNLTLAFFVCFSAFAFASEMATPESIDGTTRVTAEDIFDLVDEHDSLVIIDARKPADREPGYIEGSVALPDFETTPETLAANIPSKATPVVFYCNGPKCGRSVKASQMAVGQGYSSVYWFRGGWQEWSEKGLPVATD